MAGYIGSKTSVTQVDGYNRTEADAEFVNVTGDTMTGNLSFGDNDKAIFGAGSDLQIYHDGSRSIIQDNGTGNLRIQANNLELNNADNSENYLFAANNSAVTLYYDNAEKLATTSTGVDITGTLTSDGLTVDGVSTLTSNSSADGILLNGRSDNISQFTFRSNDGATNYSQLQSRSTEMFVKTLANIPMSFHTNNTERLSIENNGDISFYEDTGTTPKLFWDASAESLGIGTTPSTKIDAVGSTSTSSGIVDTLRLRNTGSAFGDGAKIQFTAGVNSTSGAGIGSGGVALNSADLRFYSGGNTERMRIGPSGATSIGTTTSSGQLTVKATADRAAGSFIVNANGDSAISIKNSSSTTVGTIVANASSTAYNTSSDYRLKTDAQPMTGASARVQALNPVNFEWIADGTRVDGFLAHEAQAVVPEAVTGTKDAMRDEEYEVTPAVYEDVVIPAVLDDEGNEVEAERTEQQLVTEAVMGTRSVPDYQGIDQSKLVPLLTAALQEALTEISDLKARVVALEAV